ncbi:hypothetical protein M422DRAFT_182303 [Sphaerobolus stellatus SS14]|uniref:Uncharacterized protein n=1 Tax=Sphaerobolus stellatus (strain SS14) TaxID=990650 RepID=A0A0C9VAK0_SPHS4|nr:hypothetical protein M422DRAFT_182303 [Sphaerobolus stellatus SS14]
MLVKLWTDKFKGLNVGSGDYNIPENIWEQIAELWCFWFQYIAPYVLEGRLGDKYYKHVLLLCEICKMCLEFSITEEQVNRLEEMIYQWVTEYEEYYYQYQKERLSTCTSCVHAMLHIAHDIRTTGPVWAHWCYLMERFCGLIVAAVKSRSKPYVNMSRRLLHLSQLSQIEHQYNISEELQFDDNIKGISSKEHVYPEAPASILRFPRNLAYHADLTLRRKIAVYLSTEMEIPYNLLLPLIPQYMERWAKVRIAGGGDCIWTREAGANRSGRDQSYVRYDLQIDVHADDPNAEPEMKFCCCYGQLQKILVCTLPSHHFLKDKPNRRLFALVQSCQTNYQDATLGPVTYTDMHTASRIIDLRSISCVIGRVKVGIGKGRWGIIDRSASAGRTILLDDPELIDKMYEDDQ